MDHQVKEQEQSLLDTVWSEVSERIARSNRDRGILTVGLLASLVLVVGVLLPWAIWSGFSDVRTARISASGSVTAVGIASLGAGIVIGVGSMLRYATHRMWPAALAFVGAVAGFCLAGDAIFNKEQVFASFAASHGLPARTASIGVGLPVVLGSATLAILLYLFDMVRHN